MKYTISILLCISLLNAKIEIIASPSCHIEKISKSEVKKLFMIKKTSIDNEKITVLDSNNSQTYKEFLKKFLNKSPRKLKVYWTRMLFTGKKVAPAKFSNKILNSKESNNTCYMSYEKLVNKPKNWKIIELK